MTVGTAVSSLMALCGKGAADSNLPTGMLNAARAAVNSACEEARITAPSLFGLRKRFTLSGPGSVSFILDSDGITFSDVSGSIPGVGCTLLLDGATYHNTVATLGAVEADIVTVSGGCEIDGNSADGDYFWDGAIVEGQKHYLHEEGTFELYQSGAGWTLNAIPDGGGFFFNSELGVDPSSTVPISGLYQTSGTATSGGTTVILDTTTVLGGTLDRAAEGTYPTTRTATVWNDCWVSTSSAVRILSDVSANGVPIRCLRGPEELRSMVDGIQSFSQGYPIVPSTYGAGTNSTTVVPNQFPENAGNGYRTPYQGTDVFACWPDDFAPAGVRLRFAPMPGAATLIELVTVSFPDVSSDGADLLIPNGLDTLIFVPLAEWHWMRSSWFKPEARQADAIRVAYSAALRRLTNHGPAAGFIGRG